jgi:hypothetical protein
LLLGAGSLTAAALQTDGFLNVVCEPGELASRVDALSAHVARLPSDLIGLKKRAHDARMRFANAI